MTVRLKRRRVRRKVTVDFTPRPRRWSFGGSLTGRPGRTHADTIRSRVDERELPRIQDLFDSYDEDK